MAFVLEEIYNTMTNDTDFTSKKEKIIDTERIERQPQKKKANIISHQEIEKLLKGRSLVSQNTKEILECVIPNYYINSWNKDDFLIPKDDRKCQKDIFWFLISLQYRKLNLGELNLEMGYYKNNNNPMPYLKRLILDGIQENAINGWYKIKPKNIPYEWIKKNIDPLIIEHVFFPNQVEFIPEHLRLYGKLHAWKFIILPDLVNKLEQYFGANRDDFPFTEYEKSYLTEDDDYSGFYSGIS